MKLCVPWIPRHQPVARGYFTATVLLVVAVAGSGCLGKGSNFSSPTTSHTNLRPPSTAIIAPTQAMLSHPSPYYHPRNSFSPPIYSQLLALPVNITPLVSPSSPGEGVWNPIGQGSPQGHGVFETFLRPTPTSSPIALAWIDQSAVRTVLYAGTSQPSGNWPPQGYITQLDLSNLVAAFNSGFQLNVSGGGWYENGSYASPLIAGKASLVFYKNGTLNIGAWGSDITLDPSVVAVRQNLDLLVEGDHVTAQASIDPLVTWGYSLGQRLFTWRSGIGIDSNGNLLWAGGPGLSPQLLGEILLRAGAIRAMELDINPDWVSFTTFNPSVGGPPTGTNLLATMYFPPDHYLMPFWRDFIAVVLRG